MVIEIEYKFKGLMCPVFTAFKKDDRQTVNYEIIPSYAKFLKVKGVNGILVNGTSGEGMSLNTEERKMVTEKWMEQCKKLDISMMVQIGGTSFTDVIDLAIHAEALKVDAILCLPELYFKPKTEEKLVEYFQNISKYCPNTPMLYYHIPAFTNVNLNMPRFLNLAESIKNFVGLKYTSGDLDQGYGCLKSNRCVFLGADTVLCAALTLGFDSTIMTTLNIFPELSIEIVDLINKGKIIEARKIQQKLNDRIQEILKKHNGDWVTCMKHEFNIKVPELNVGLPRKPLFH